MQGQNGEVHRRGRDGPVVESGAYTVQPVPAPCMPAGPSTNMEIRSSVQRPEPDSQKEMLFMRGKAMSGAPIMSGTNQLPKPPTMAGMIMKNTMIRPWAVTKAVEHVLAIVDGSIGRLTP